MPMRYLTKADAVYQEVRRQILLGTLPPGSTVNQEQLAARLEVSTTPLREALRRLETVGLIRTNGAHRDVTVAPLDIGEMRDLYESREALDCLAVALAAERHDAAEGDEIRAALDALATPAAGDPLELNRAFHRAIYAACHNAVLVAQLDALWDRSDRYRRLAGMLATDSHVAEDHEALVAAVLDRRGADAAEIMRGHLAITRDFLERQLSEQVPSAVDR
jgi:DNA-binding GntR family transcriptional regulator